MPDQKNKDEIDLVEFFLKAINVFRANFWLIVTFFLLGSALGLAYFYSAKKVFENKMIISSSLLTESNCKILFEIVNRHRTEGNLSALATQFNIPEAMVKEIYSISIERLAEMEEDESDRFLITAVVYDQQILPEFQKGLVAYLENNDFVKTRVEQEKRYLKETIAEIEKEIEDLEEFKLRIFKGDFFETAKGNVMFDPTVVNSKILELTEKKVTLQNDLQSANSVQVIVGFTKFDKQTRPKLSVSLVSGSFVGLFFVGLLIAFKSIRKLVTMAEATK